MRNWLIDARVDKGSSAGGLLPMSVDLQALHIATQTLAQLFSAEAERQHAYIFHFPDGRISLELEWVDINDIVGKVIASYLVHANQTAS